MAALGYIYIANNKTNTWQSNSSKSIPRPWHNLRDNITYFESAVTLLRPGTLQAISRQYYMLSPLFVVNMLHLKGENGRFLIDSMVTLLVMCRQISDCSTCDFI